MAGRAWLAAHGWPRTTKDIDLWVRPTSENAVRVLRALVSFGAPLSGLTTSDLETAGTIFQIGVPPRRIDLLTTIDGVDFETAWPGRTLVALDGLDVPVLGRADLVRNKRASARPQDLLDVERLESLPPEPPRPSST